MRYEPGELKVKVFDEMGNNCGEQAVRTAGKPAKLKLDVWTQSDDGILRADGEDLAFVTVTLVDKRGTLIPDAADQLHFEVTGAGKFRAVCNGDATSLEPFTQPTMKLFSGQLVAVVQSSDKAGALTLKVTDKDRKMKVQTTIQVR